MRSYRVRLTQGAERDLLELEEFLAEHDLDAAQRAVGAEREAFALLTRFPWAARKNALANDPRLRELLVPFGRAGYVVLFEIEDERTVTVLAVRHQREDDYR